MTNAISYLLLSFVPFVFGANPATTYRVRSIERRTQKRNIYNRRENILTHSDDGGTKILTPFFLDLFETHGELSDSALPVLRMAMNKFLMRELNAIYKPDNNELEAVASGIIGKPKAISFSDGDNRMLSETNKMGTTVMMEVELTFDNEPSPTREELNPKLREVMSNLTYFVTNLTAYKNQEFKDVTEAYRRDVITDSPTQAPKNGVNDAQNDGNGQGQNKWYLSTTSIAIPSALFAASLVAVVMYLVVRRRKRSDVENSKSEMHFVDVENNTYSFDKSLESSRSPPGIYSSSTTSSDDSRTKSSQDDDSVFVGVDLAPGVQKSRSAYTQSSSTTIPASNRFAKYRYNTVYQEEKNNRQGIPGRPSLSTETSKGEESSEESSGSEPGSSGHVLADLATFASCTTPTKPKAATPLTPSQRDTPSRYGKTHEENEASNTSFGLFQCKPTQSEKEPPTVTLTPNSNNERRRLENEKTPLVRNLSREEDQDYSQENAGGMSGKSLQMFGKSEVDRSLTPTRRRSKSPSRSRSSTPNGSRPTTPSRGKPNKSRSTTPNRSSSMTPNQNRTTDDKNDTNMGYGCSPFGNLLNSAAQKKNCPEPKSGNVIIEGLNNALLCSGGRRHAGNNQDIDGSAMYQQNAMDIDRLEWSYKSVDEPSIGDSTISEADGAILPQQVLNSATKKSARNNSPKTPRSVKSTTSQKSASQQLIHDLSWIEKKIADVRRQPTQQVVPNNPPEVETADSLSYASNDNNGFESPLSQTNSPYHNDVYASRDESVMSSIVCRDCYAPPGKLHIVIHSTKDGPAVHSVKPGSSLEGHIFPGDLIISVRFCLLGLYIFLLSFCNLIFSLSLCKA